MTTDSDRSLLSLVEIESLPIAGVELIKQFTHCQLQAYASPRQTSIQTSNQISNQISNGKPKSTLYLIGWGCDRYQSGRSIHPQDSITQLQANELLCHFLRRTCLPVLQALPHWHQLNANQQGALLSLAHSLDKDLAILSERSLLGRALRHRRWYQVPTIISGYYGLASADNIAYRRQEEAKLFSTELHKEHFVVINRSRVLTLQEPALTGRDIQKLQNALRERGFEISADGQFGPMTQWAVEKFQALAGLPVNGVADVATQRILYARPLFMQRPYLIGSDVHEVQSALARIGYAVDVNGIFNPRTLQATIAFQRYFGFPEDGILKDKTLAKLLYWPQVTSVS